MAGLTTLLGNRLTWFTVAHVMLFSTFARYAPVSSVADTVRFAATTMGPIGMVAGPVALSPDLKWMADGLRPVLSEGSACERPPL
ncbi:hypothetical protein [Methylobacterium sp. 77]|uniref:hypothetical protein n=1 Tax=Methylobacterium sp. 77 TaxID=1101192 RepID=UPI00037FFD1B|nr:hypothetical protein [Methylobacterium sp. 77]